MADIDVWVGVDPGDVTGVAYRLSSGVYVSVELLPDDVMPYLADVVSESRFNVKVIGCEQYVERGNQRKTNQPLAQRLTGAVQTLEIPCVLVPPSTAKRMCNDQRLKDLGWYRRTKDGHQNDAGRVLFATIALTSPKELARLIPST